VFIKVRVVPQKHIMQHDKDEVDDCIGPRLSCSLHLDDIWSENKDSNLNAHSAPSESVDKNLSDKIKLFKMYVSACERNGPGSEDSDSSDDSIHHGRDFCASSRGGRDEQSQTALDSFLLKPGRLSTVGGEADLVPSSSRAASIVDRVRVSSISENPVRRQHSFSGWPCERIELPAFGSFKAERSRPSSGSFHRPFSANLGDFDMYKKQVVAALTSGKPVWL
jgi:hypothetical protein